MQQSKNRSNEYLIFVRKALSQLAALGLVLVENKLYSINKSGNTNLSIADILEPMNNTELKELINKGVDLNKIYVGNVKDFSGIFQNFSRDLKDALGQDTWHVENMSEIFKDADLKGAGLSGWEVNNVKSLKSAFENARGIAGIENWETERI